MAEVYRQTDTAAPLGVIQACSPVAPTGDADAREGVVGGTPGATANAAAIPSASTVTVYCDELRIADDDTLAAGTLVHRFNVSTAQNNLTLEDIFVCRVNSSGVSQETLGSAEGLGTDISAGGVFTTNVTLSAASAHNAGDRVYITVAVANAHTMTARNLEVLPNQNIDTPFEVASSDETGTQDAPATATWAALDGTSQAEATATQDTAATALWSALDATGSTTTPDQTATQDTPASSAWAGANAVASLIATTAIAFVTATTLGAGAQTATQDAPATSAWEALDATAQPGEATATAELASAAWTALDATPQTVGTAVQDAPASASWAVLDGVATPGVVTALQDAAASSTWSALDGSGSLEGAPQTATGTLATAAWLARDATVQASATATQDAPATADWTALDATAVPGAVQGSQDAAAVAAWAALDGLAVLADAPQTATATLATAAWVALDATGSTTPTVRIVQVGADDRTLVTVAEDRTAATAADDRTLTTDADDRTLAVTSEDRTLTVPEV